MDHVNWLTVVDGSSLPENEKDENVFPFTPGQMVILKGKYNAAL
jgi:hypothetical protein